MSSAPRVLVLDSGIGGLSVVAALRAARPDIGLTYLGDFAGFPYGDQDDDALAARLERVLRPVAARLRPDAILIACNTASTVALPGLRAAFACPVVGCVPPIKTAAERSATRRIGLLATPATARRAYVQDLMDRFGDGCILHTHGSATLATLAEAAFRGDAVDREAVAAELRALTDQPGARAIDAVALGCTHYAFLLPILRGLAPDVSHWLDPAGPVARRLSAVVGPAATGAAPPPAQDGLALLTGDARPGTRRGLHAHGFGRIEALPLPA